MMRNHGLLEVVRKFFEDENSTVPPKPKLPHEPVGRCAKCGLALYQKMMYSCPHHDCPCGLGSRATM